MFRIKTSYWSRSFQSRINFPNGYKFSILKVPKKYFNLSFSSSLPEKKNKKKKLKINFNWWMFIGCRRRKGREKYKNFSNVSMGPRCLVKGVKNYFHIFLILLMSQTQIWISKKGPALLEPPPLATSLTEPENSILNIVDHELRKERRINSKSKYLFAFKSIRKKYVDRKL